MRGFYRRLDFGDQARPREARGHRLQSATEQSRGNFVSIITTVRCKSQNEPDVVAWACDAVSLSGCQDCIPASRHRRSRRHSRPRLNCPLRIRSSSSIPAMVTAAVLNCLNPSIGAILEFASQWSWSIRLFYFDDRPLVSAGRSPPVFISRTCDAAYPSCVPIRGPQSLTLDRRAKESLGRSNVTLWAKTKVDSVPGRIDRPVEIDPFAADLPHATTLPPAARNGFSGARVPAHNGAPNA